jgi:hypothetical protein
MALCNAYQRKVLSRVPFPSLSANRVHLAFRNMNEAGPSAGFFSAIDAHGDRSDGYWILFQLLLL